MNRRNFVKTVAGASAGIGFLSGCTSEGQEPEERRLHTLGLQLYTVRELMKEDPIQTLRDVAAIGYDEVEFAGYHGVETGDLRKILDDLGMTTPSAHWMPSMFTGGIEPIAAELSEALEDAQTMGHEYLVLPWIDDNDSLTMNDYRAIADTCNQIGEQCRQAGIQLAYHNHAFEFRAIDGILPMDLLLSETDADLMQWEMDFFWVVDGGQQPLEYIERQAGRISLCHVKDRSASGEMVDVGKGTIDFARIFARSGLAGLQHYFVEHDNPADPMETIRASFGHLTQLKYTVDEGRDDG